MVEAGGRTAQSFGLNRLLGQIYMCLYMSHEARCLDDLAETLGVSKASVSIACRQLLALGGIKRVWHKGDRRDFYEAETDFRSLVQNGLLRELQKKLQSAEVQIDLCRGLFEKAAADHPDESDFLLQRLDHAARYRSRIAGLIDNPLLKRLFH
jgi:DNA-binding transcriptional regulator GbsR (MarR family)